MHFIDGYGYSYTHPGYSSVDSALMTVLMIYLGVFLVIGIFSLASYIIKGLGMYRMAQREGMDNPWLAFVPFARTYLQGELSGDIEFKKRSIRNPGIWMIILPIAGSMVIGVFYVILIIVMTAMILAIEGSGSGIGFVVGMVVIIMILYILLLVVYQALVMVLKSLVIYQILCKYTSANMAIAHAVLCNLIPLYESIVLFAYRNKPYQEGKEPIVPPMQPENVPVSEVLKNPEVPESPEPAVETEKKPYVYSDSVSLSSQEPESYDVGEQE